MPVSLRDRVVASVRRHGGAFLTDNTFRGIAYLGKLHPRANPKRHGVKVIRNLRYLEGRTKDHTLDVYLPDAASSAKAPLPVVFYVHGGGFRILSKDSHWVMALAFARRGFVVFTINYRLAPRHPYPAALQDACAALLYAVQKAPSYGGDPSRLVLAGESAGANLVTALAVATSYRRPEPYARALFDAGVQARAALPACGILQVSDPERFWRRKKLPSFVRDRIVEVSRAYLGQSQPTWGQELADPLVVLESGQEPDRPLPAFFAGVGTADPLLDDTRRLKVALDRLGVPCESRYYPREIHAFHALVFRRAAKEFWRDTYGFLDSVLGPPNKGA